MNRPALRAACRHAALGLASAAALLPVAWVALTSVKTRGEVFTTGLDLLPRAWAWDNYLYLLTMREGIFLTWLWNSAVIALATTVVGLSLAAPAAYAFSRYTFPGYRPALVAILVTQMFPGAILIVPLYNLLRAWGLLNSYGGLILTYASIALPFCIWMLKSYFDTIPRALEEAAMVDGLSPLGTFLRVVLPLSLPGIAVTAFFAFVTAWNEFMFALTFMSREELYTLPVGLRGFVFQFRTDWHLLSAGAMLVTAPVLGVFLYAQRYLVSGLTAGGAKG